MRKIVESEITQPDVKAIFRGAADLRNKPSGFGRVFKRLRKDKIEVIDLQQAWKSEGFPDDTRDIERILAGFGFDKKEINRVFSDVFGKTDDDRYQEPVASPTIMKIATYAKKNGLAETLIEFMEKEFADELGMGKKTTTEDVRSIFQQMAQIDRPNRHFLIKEQEQTHLGRKRK